METVLERLITPDLTEFGTFHSVIGAFDLKKPDKETVKASIARAEKAISSRYAVATITAGQIRTCPVLFDILKELGWTFCGQKQNPDHGALSMLYLFFKVFPKRSTKNARGLQDRGYWQGASEDLLEYAAKIGYSECCCGLRLFGYKSIEDLSVRTKYLALWKGTNKITNKDATRLKANGWHKVYSYYSNSFWTNAKQPKPARTHAK